VFRLFRIELRWRLVSPRIGIPYLALFGLAVVGTVTQGGVVARVAGALLFVLSIGVVLSPIHVVRRERVTRD
jgi:hypothetical protein